MDVTAGAFPSVRPQSFADAGKTQRAHMKAMVATTTMDTNDLTVRWEASSEWNARLK